MLKIIHPFLLLFIFLFQSTQADLFLTEVQIPSNNFVNQNTVYNFKILTSPAITYQQGSSFEITFPSTVSISGGSVTVCQTIDSTNSATILTLSCTVSSNIVRFTLPADAQTNSGLIIQIGQFSNPASAQTLSGFNLKIDNPSGTNVKNTAMVSSNAKIFANPLLSSTVSSSSLLTNQLATYTFTFKIQDSIPSGGFILITFPTSSIQVPESPSTVVNVYGDVITDTTVTTNSSTIKIGGVFPSGLTFDTTKTIEVQITGIQNPNSLKPTSSFSVATTDSSNRQINDVSSGLSVTMTTASPIQISSVGPYQSAEVGKSTDISFLMNFTAQHSANGYFLITVPPEISITSLICTYISGFVTTIQTICSFESGTGSTQIIRIQQEIYQTQVFFLVNTVTNPANTKPTSSFIFYQYDSSNYKMGELTSNAVYQVSPGVMKSISVTRANSGIGDDLGNYLTIMFQISNKVLSGEYFEFFIPYDQMLIGAAGVKVEYLGQIVSHQLNLSNSSYFNITVSAPCPSNCLPNTAFTYKISGLKNPLWITDPLTSSISIQSVTSDKLYLIDSTTSGVQTLPSLVSGVLEDVSLYKGLSLAGGDGSYELEFKIKNQIPANGYIQFGFPYYAAFYPDDDIIYARDMTNEVTLYLNTVMYTISERGVKYIEVINQCTSGCASGTVISIKFTKVKNPVSTKAITNNFSVKTLTSERYLIDSSIITDAEDLVLMANNFEYYSLISPVSPIVTGSVSLYKLQIQSKTGIQYSTGVLKITFPFQVTFTSSAKTCKATASGDTLTCKLDTANMMAQISNPFSGKTYSSSIITVEVDNIKNPVTTSESNSFKLENMVKDAIDLNYYQVDFYFDSLKVVPDTPNAITNISIVRSVTLISESTNLDIQCTTTNAVTQNAYVLVYLPIDQVTIPVGASVSAKDMNNNANIYVVSVTYVTNYAVIKLQEWCSFGDPSCPEYSTLNFRLTGAINVATTNPSTLSFKIVIQVSEGVLIDQTTSGILATPILSAGAFKSVSFSQSSDVVSKSTSLTITLQSKNYIDSDEASFQLIFPPNLFYQTSTAVQCNVNTVTYPCPIATAADTYGTYISLINFDYDCPSSGCNENDYYAIVVSNIQNRFSTATYPGGSFILSSADSLNNSVDASIVVFASSLLSNQLIITNTATITSIIASNLTVGASTDLTVNFQIGTRLLKYSYYTIYVPLDAYSIPNLSKLSCTKGVFTLSCASYETNSTHFGVQFQDNSTIALLVSESTTLSIVVKGFQNRYNTLVTNTPFYIKTQTPTLYDVEFSGTGIVYNSNTLLSLVYGVTQQFVRSVLVGNLFNYTMSFNVLDTVMSGDTVIVELSSSIFLSSLSETCSMKTSSSQYETTTCSILYDGAQNTQIYEPINEISMQFPMSVAFGTQITIMVSEVYNFFEAKKIETTAAITLETDSVVKIAEGSAIFSQYILKPVSFSEFKCERVDGVVDYDTPVMIDIIFGTPISILENSMMNITIPKTQFISTTSTYDDLQCTFQSNIIPCTIVYEDSLSYYIHTENSLCSIGNEGCDLFYNTFSLEISGFKNPQQALPNVQSLNMSISHGDNEIVVNPQLNGIKVIATPQLEVKYLDYFSVKQNLSMKTGMNTMLTFWMQLPEAVASTSQLVIVIPSETMYLNGSDTPICTPSTSSKLKFSCSYTEDRGHINTITVSNFCSKSDCSALNANISLVVTGLTNVAYARDRVQDNLISVYVVSEEGFIFYTGNQSEKVLNDIVPNDISDFSVVRSDVEVGTNNVVNTLYFTSPNRLKDGSEVYITIPIEQIQFEQYDTFYCGYSLKSYKITCTLVNITDTHLTLKFTEYCSDGCAPSFNFIIQISETLNPPSLQSNFPSTFFSIVVVHPNGFIIEWLQNSIVQVKPDLAGIILEDVMIQRESSIIGSDDYLNIVIPLSNMLDKQSAFTITMPEQIAYGVSLVECEQYVFGSWVSKECSYTYYGNSLSQYGVRAVKNMTVNGICSNQAVCQPKQYITLRLKMRNPFTQYQNLTLPFKIYVTLNQYLSGFAEIKNQLSPLKPNIISPVLTQTSDEGQNCDLTGSLCNAQFTIKTSNHVPTQINNGFMVINVPTQMSIQTTNCTASLFNDKSNVSCEVVGNRQIQVRFNRTISNSTFIYEFKVFVSQLKNPFSTKMSDSFEIATYQKVNQKIYQIDEINSGMNYNVSAPNTFSGVYIVRDNQNSRDSTMITVIVSTKNIIPNNASFIMEIPKIQAVLGNVQCSGGSIQCSYISETKFNVTNICNDFFGFCASPYTFSFQFQATNPSLIKDPLLDSDSIIVSTEYTHNGTTYQIDRTNTDLFITPMLIPSKDISVTSIEITKYKTSQFVNMTIIAQRIIANEVFTQDYIRVKFYSASFNQNGLYKISGSVNGQSDKEIVTSSFSNNSLIYVAIKCGTQCKGKKEVKIEILSLQNPYFVLKRDYLSEEVQIAVQDLEEFPDKVKGEGRSDISSSIMKKISLSNITDAQLSQSTGGNGSISDVSIMFSIGGNPIVKQNSILYVTLPSGFSVDHSSFSVSNVFDNTQQYQYVQNSNELQISYFQSTESVQRVALLLKGVKNSVNIQKSNVQMQVSNENEVYAQDSFVIVSQKMSSNCTGSCSLCGTDGTCYECNKDPSKQYLLNNNCVSSCPSNYFNKDNTCYQCGEGCKSCETYDSCSTCKTPLKFMDGHCLSSDCPSPLILNSNNQCVRTDGCTGDCITCGISSSYCYSCSSPLLSKNGKCVSDCPSNYFISQQQCYKCDSECLKCEDRSDKCTDCNKKSETASILDLSINQCVSSCSSTAYPSPNNEYLCESCDSKCYTCSGTPDNCTSCYYNKETFEDLFYVDGTCESKCGFGEYQNYLTHECEDQPYIYNNLPTLYLASSVGLTVGLVAVSKFASSKLDSSADLLIVGFTQIEFMQRLLLLGNLWFSTKSFSFCVTGMTLVANSMMGVYFVSLVLGPMASQLGGATSSIAFKATVVMSQVSGINTVRLATSGFMGIKGLQNNFNQIPYYSTQLEMLSLISGCLSLFQAFTGVSNIFDFSRNQDAFGFGANSIATNGLLVGMQTYKYIQARNLMTKSYSAVSST